MPAICSCSMFRLIRLANGFVVSRLRVNSFHLPPQTFHHGRRRQGHIIGASVRGVSAMAEDEGGHRQTVTATKIDRRSVQTLALAGLNEALFSPQDIQSTTTGEWDENLGRLMRYKKEHGNCLVPVRYKMENGAKLGIWVSSQRTAYSKFTLSEERTQQLDELGFAWDSHTAEWDDNLGRLVRYKEGHGDCLVPSGYEMEDGVKLGVWVNTQRTAYSKFTMSEERTQRLEKLGFVWDRLIAEWDDNLDRLVRYIKGHGDCLVPRLYETEGGVKLGVWVNTQRTAYSKGTLSEERTQRLDELGFVWGSHTAEWDDNFGRLVRYKDGQGDCLVPSSYETEGGAKLGQWVSRQRKSYSKDKLCEERTQRLEELGFIWDTLSAEWYGNLGRLVRYKEERGDCLVPRGYETEDGAKLGHWVNTQRATYSKGTLREERTQWLDELGFAWDTITAEWDDNLGRLVRYKEGHGDCLVPARYEMEDGAKLGQWVSRQRKAESKSTLREERTQRLEELGFVWKSDKAK